MLNKINQIRKTKFFIHFIKKPLAVTALVVISILFLGALFAPVIAPQNPYDMDKLDLANSLLPPIWMEGGQFPYLLGTDVQGRDIFSTILYGSRTSFLVGISVVVISGLLGGGVGLFAGYFGGIFDTVVMRTADTVLSFSKTLIAMLLLGVFRQSSVILVILAIVVSDWVQYARTIRGEVLSVKEEEYVLASQAIGGTSLRTVFKHVLPNSVSPLLVVAAVDFGIAIMLEATLSFLGVGIPVTQPSLGMMISQGRNYLYAGKWWLIFFPGLTLMALVFSLNLISDWLRDEIDPKVKNI
ncbi:MAG: ABC transporter permease [Halanaerobiales bacterium]|nr:ABC transporter permease [Halanaerobiales bacterium]